MGQGRDAFFQPLHRGKPQRQRVIARLLREAIHHWRQLQRADITPLTGFRQGFNLGFIFGHVPHAVAGVVLDHDGNVITLIQQRIIDGRLAGLVIPGCHGDILRITRGGNARQHIAQATGPCPGGLRHLKARLRQMIGQHHAQNPRDRRRHHTPPLGQRCGLEQLEGFKKLRLRAGGDNAQPVKQRLPSRPSPRHRRRVRGRNPRAFLRLAELDGDDGLAQPQGLGSSPTQSGDVMEGFKRQAHGGDGRIIEQMFDNGLKTRDRLIAPRHQMGDRQAAITKDRIT